MREFLYTVGLLAVLAAIGLWIDNPDPPAAGTSIGTSAATDQGGEWRRTNRGWERLDLSITVQPQQDIAVKESPSDYLSDIENWELPHPFLIVVFQVTTCLAALLFFGKEKKE